MKIKKIEVEQLKKEKPCYYKGDFEAIYVIQGRIELIDIDSQEIVTIKRDEFFVFNNKRAMARKYKANTVFLHIFSDSVDAFKFVECKELNIIRWLDDPIISKRIDHYHNLDAPDVNHIIPAATAGILNEKKEILLLHRNDNGFWTLPGGTMRLSEGIEECLIREVKEETNLDITIKEIVKIYSDPCVIVEYDDGEVRREFNVLYFANIENYNIKLDDESHDFKWVSFGNVLDYKLTPAQRIRMIDLLAYLKKQ